jgi:hypothetical protein
VNDSGDRVVAADRPQGTEVLDVRLHGSDRRAEASLRDLGTAALNEHALLATVNQRLHGGAADVAESSSNQDHHCLLGRPFN